MPTDQTTSPSEITVVGSLTLFGFPSTEMQARVIPRSRAWRRFRASGYLAMGVILSPLVGLVPPHAPWAAGALGVGLFFGIRKWREKLTLLSLEGSCPKCHSPLALQQGGSLRNGMSVPCDACHHDSILKLSDEAEK